MTPRYKHRDLRFSVCLKAPSERAWRCLTSARELSAWWAERAETDARNGGKLRLLWPEAGGTLTPEARGVFVDLEPARKAAWMWAKAPRGVPALVTFFVEPRRGGCTVTLLHAGFSSAPSSDRRYQAWSRFWQDCLAKLALYLEAGRTFKTERLTLADLERQRRPRPARAALSLAR